MVLKLLTTLKARPSDPDAYRWGIPLRYVPYWAAEDTQGWVRVGYEPVMGADVYTARRSAWLYRILGWLAAVGAGLRRVV
jgi:hypothetical protein